ncbi:uncharacterized protein PRCAT00001485001 [Priceomyces carsonii]|uniref:uncharacterized protein n=1 Tax=Priceomyces carsonii TaxID=28549 RepID=UPI002ED8D201|nr:unnamed protein product [Priceomyces carsonii]
MRMLLGYKKLSLLQNDTSVRDDLDCLKSREDIDPCHLYETTESLLHVIRTILPSRAITWKLITVYFRYIYAYWPFFDEDYFRVEISNIIGDENVDGEVIYPVIRNKETFAYLGCLLVILRVSYLLCILDNKNFGNMSYAITNEAIYVANLFLRRYDLTSRVSLPVLQCALCLRLHQRIDPEIAEGFNQKVNNSINTGMLVQMAYSLGLNREPQRYTIREKRLRKKIWTILLIFDVLEASSSGSVLCINRNYCSTKPCDVEDFEEGSKNALSSLERIVLQNFKDLSFLVKYKTDIINKVLDVNGRTKVSDFVQLMNNFEIEAFKSVGFLRDFLTPAFLDSTELETYNKTYKAKLILTTRSFLLPLYVHLCLFFESRSILELKLFYEKKTQCVIMGEMLPILLSLAEDSNNFCGPVGVLILISSFVQILHRANLINIAIFIRLKYHMYHFENIYDHADEKQSIHLNLETVVQKLEKCILIFLNCVSKLCNEYHHSGVVPLVYKSYLNATKEREFYEKRPGDELFEKTVYTNEHLKQMNIIYNDALKCIGPAYASTFSFDLLDGYHECEDFVDLKQNWPGSCAI